MKLYTSVEIAPCARKIGYGDKILLLGSCFADNIGAKFAEQYFQATINPLGTLYNPASIALSITDSQHSIPDSRLIYHNGLWHSMMHHGTFSGMDKVAVQDRCLDGYERLQRALKEATTVIVTFGTAWVYEMDGQVVANCHKLPANRFTRRCLAVDEIVEMWQPIVASMPDKQWIFTVSPIRHVKDGLHANQMSKAILLQAVDELGQSYFPSYEIMMDELRDYRFYAEDMVHPSQVAVEYIWQRFVETYMTEDTRGEMLTLHQLWQDCHHRFLHPDSEEAERFRLHVERQMVALKERYPWIIG
jgi:hypothetical protein